MMGVMEARVRTWGGCRWCAVLMALTLLATASASAAAPADVEPLSYESFETDDAVVIQGKLLNFYFMSECHENSKRGTIWHIDGTFSNSISGVVQ